MGNSQIKSLGKNPEFSKREEQIVPPSFLIEFLLVISIAIYAGGGFGQKFLVEAAFLVVLTLSAFSLRQKAKLGIIGAVAVVCILIPALIQASSLLAAILLMGGRTRNALFCLLGSTLQIVLPINPFYLPIVLFVFQVPFLFGKLHLPKRYLQWPIVVLLLINLIPALLPATAPLAHQEFPYPYRVDTGKWIDVVNKGISYSSMDDAGDLINASVYVLEHDPPHNLTQSNWQQQRLWCQNQYFGAEFLKIAAVLDGFVFSNLGCRINHRGLRLLGEAHDGEHNEFISRNLDRVIFSDSDFLTNGACGYQLNLINSLFRHISIAHFIFFSASLSCFALLFSNNTIMVGALMSITTIFPLVFTKNSKVDIKIIDNHAIWPHSPGVGGLGMDVDENTGIRSVSRNGKSQVLGIARDCTADYSGEKLIFMEGGSKIQINGVTFTSLDHPMGEEDGITDAIPIRNSYDQTEKSRQKINDVILIGTNSARKNWRLIYDSKNGIK